MLFEEFKSMRPLWVNAKSVTSVSECKISDLCHLTQNQWPRLVNAKLVTFLSECIVSDLREWMQNKWPLWLNKELVTSVSECSISHKWFEPQYDGGN